MSGAESYEWGNILVHRQTIHNPETPSLYFTSSYSRSRSGNPRAGEQDDNGQAHHPPRHFVLLCRRVLLFLLYSSDRAQLAGSPERHHYSHIHIFARPLNKLWLASIHRHLFLSDISCYTPVFKHNPPVASAQHMLVVALAPCKLCTLRTGGTFQTRTHPKALRLQRPTDSSARVLL
jgi:hypothetical protein